MQYDKFTWNTAKAIRQLLGNQQVDEYLGATYLYNYPQLQQHVKAATRAYFGFPAAALHPFNVSDSIFVTVNMDLAPTEGPFPVYNSTASLDQLWQHLPSSVVQNAAQILVEYSFASRQVNFWMACSRAFLYCIILCDGCYCCCRCWCCCYSCFRYY